MTKQLMTLRDYGSWFKKGQVLTAENYNTLQFNNSTFHDAPTSDVLISVFCPDMKMSGNFPESYFRETRKGDMFTLTEGVLTLAVEGPRGLPDVGRIILYGQKGIKAEVLALDGNFAFMKAVSPWNDRAPFVLNFNEEYLQDWEYTYA